MRTYSTYEAKAKFSEILRQVRQGRTVRISYRGEPVAEIRPIPDVDLNAERRLDRLEERGVLVRASEPGAPLGTAVRRPGALDRFLAERDE